NEEVCCLDEVDEKTVFNWNEEELKKAPKTDFIVRLTPEGVRMLEGNGRLQPHIECEPDGSGRIDISIPWKDVAFFADMVWMLGPEAVIIEPPEAREWVNARLAAMQRQYAERIPESESRQVTDIPKSQAP
ncbi:WYL domain-containing protein, partial [Paenibacillus sp. AR247]|uniref:WYL domain-containing protein n=1 Tax=Paenibacillus sp. AR247 TaxID=1631599 RepID=UPI000D487B2A